MASYEEHEQAAIELLAPLRGAMGGRVQPDYRLQMAQVEATLALAAAITGRRQEGGSASQPSIGGPGF